MKQIISSIMIILIASSSITAQDQTASFFAGFGSQGGVIRADIKIAEGFIKNSSTRLYFEGGLKGKKFSEENFEFENVNYPSDSRIIFAGLGISQEFSQKNFRIAPYVGLRYAYARFKDRSLVDAIGEQTLIRYWNGQVVGPTVENGYGDAVTVDAGMRLGVKLTTTIEIYIAGGFSPLKFSTAATVFGKYWGESPYPNDFYINLPVARGEGGLRFHF